MPWPVLFCAVLLTVAQTSDEQLATELSVLRNQVQDRRLPMGRREQIAKDIAEKLNGAAVASPVGSVRRKLWLEAAEALELFNEAHPGHQDGTMFTLQANVYRWAVGGSLAEETEFNPALAAEAQAAQSDVVARFEKLYLDTSTSERVIVLQSIRYRYAQSLFDRSKLDAKGSEASLAKVRKAADILDWTFTAASLKAYVELLRAQIFLTLGKIDEARAAYDRGVAEPIKPDANALLSVRTRILVAGRNYGEAISAIEASSLDPILKAAESVEIRLAQRTLMEEGSNRTKVDADAIARAAPLRTSPRLEARRAILEIAKTITELSPKESPEAYDLVSDGNLRLGETDKAIALVVKGAERAVELDRKSKAAELWSRAGAIAFQAGRWDQADLYFGKVLNDPDAGTFRPRAGLLRAMSRGRALANRAPGATLAGYTDALTQQIKNFPEDPTASEARWLLGKERLANHPDEAYALWAAIPPEHPRWIEGRLAEADARQELLEVARAGGDRSLMRRATDEAKRSLAESATRAVEDDQRLEIDLRLARLLLTPGTGQAEAARSIAERWLKSSTKANQREAARRILVVALAEIGRLVDAEREARELVVNPVDITELLVPVRMLDQIAIDAETEVARRRIGLILKRFTDFLIEKIAQFTPAQQVDLQLRHARALVLSGNSNAARNLLSSVSAQAKTFSDAQLRDLADAYIRLDAHDLAADVHRLRTRQTTTGSLIWFESRYGMALCYYRSGKNKQARQLIDATALLHPELGGPEMKDKFERLRQKLGDK